MMKKMLTILLWSLWTIAIETFAAEAQSKPPSQTVAVSGSFSDNSNDEDGFRLYRCAGTGCVPTALVATLPPNTTKFTDTIAGDPGGVSYTYGISAYSNTGGESLKAVASLTSPTILIVPGAPSGISLVVTGVAIP